MLKNDLYLVIVPEKKDSQYGHAITFQLYYSIPGNEQQSLMDISNYSGILSFDPKGKQFYYTQGNHMIAPDEILRIINFIKTKIGTDL